MIVSRMKYKMTGNHSNEIGLRETISFDIAETVEMFVATSKNWVGDTALTYRTTILRGNQSSVLGYKCNYSCP